MTQDEAIAVLFRLVGDQHQCFELVKSVRGAFPERSLQWCIEQAIADVRPSISPSPAPPPLPAAAQKTLLRLLHGNVEQAQRLVQRIQAAHPNQSAQWAIDKVIYDLERDRS